MSLLEHVLEIGCVSVLREKRGGRGEFLLIWSAVDKANLYQ
jgi:hypothetical protein